MSHSINLSAGTYIVAVSGGVDSVVLLDMLSKQSNLKLIIAHFDHGIRPDSASDERFVKDLAAKYNLPFESERTELGPDASEQKAREHRYAFLRKLIQKYNAKSIITAHHEDDVIETSIINIVRGTGRSGLTSLASTDEIARPLLRMPKNQLIEYAKQHNLNWREDITNSDTKYLRNKIRLDVVANMDKEQRQNWLKILDNLHTTNHHIDNELNALIRRGLHKNQLVLSRAWFIMLPHDVAKEVIRALLLKAGASDIDRKAIERVTVQIKTFAPGKIIQASGVDILLTKRSARFLQRGGKKGLKSV